MWRTHQLGVRAAILKHEIIDISAGWFIMGASDGDEDEKPQHRVYLPAYSISKYPVTNEQFARFVELMKGYKTDAEREGMEWTWRHPHGKDSHIQDKMDHPVVQVTWRDALVYARAVGMRLPTEAEWEKAARGSDGRIYPWGNDWDSTKLNAENEFGDTTPVGHFPNGASPYGALDMAGNVWEWCSSLYKPYPYDADDGREDFQSNGYRVLRGGSWGDRRGLCRAAVRGWGGPMFFDDSVGFRVVRSSGAVL